MYDGYHALALAYDRLNAHIDYKAWSLFIQDIFDKFPQELLSVETYL